MVSQSADEKMSELESLGKHPIWLDKALTISGNTTTKEVSIKHQMLQLTLPTGRQAKGIRKVLTGTGITLQPNITRLLRACISVRIQWLF